MYPFAKTVPEESMLDEKNLRYSTNILKQLDDQTFCICAEQSHDHFIQFVDQVCVTDMSQVWISGSMRTGLSQGPWFLQTF